MIDILDSNFKKIDILRKYTFLQYNPKFRDIGTFTIHARLLKENLYLADENKTYYVLFEDEVLGKIEKVSKDEEEHNEVIVLTGRLAPLIFTKRIVLGTLEFKGKTAELVQSLVYENITKDPSSDRYLPINIIYDDMEHLFSVCSNISKQITGGYVWEHMKEVLEQDNLGVIFKPIISTVHLEDSHETNISEWELHISAGVDRTKGNTQGNTPVIFSQSLSNIARTSYTFNNEGYRNIAYVAGEGEGSNRKWYEVLQGEEVPKGWDRSELWIDARDLQTNEEGTEYSEVIKERANTKFSENAKETEYEATITEDSRPYSYGVDYFLGDWCTIVDIELNKEINVQITEVTFTMVGSRKIVDVTFSYGLGRKEKYANMEQIEKNSKSIEELIANLLYLENKVNGN